MRATQNIQRTPLTPLLVLPVPNPTVCGYSALVWVESRNLRADWPSFLLSETWRSGAGAISHA